MALPHVFFSWEGGQGFKGGNRGLPVGCSLLVAGLATENKPTKSGGSKYARTANKPSHNANGRISLVAQKFGGTFQKTAFLVTFLLFLFSREFSETSILPWRQSLLFCIFFSSQGNGGRRADKPDGVASPSISFASLFPFFLILLRGS